MAETPKGSISDFRTKFVTDRERHSYLRNDRGFINPKKPAAVLSQLDQGKQAIIVDKEKDRAAKQASKSTEQERGK